jgi:hypothetical protein
VNRLNSRAILINCYKTPTTKIILVVFYGGKVAKMKLPFISLCALLLGLSGARALKLCEEIIFSCPSGDWYAGCYGSGEAYGCKEDGSSFGPGENVAGGIVNDCGCGGNMKINWRCSVNSGTVNNPGNPGGIGPFCWCQLANTSNIAGSWIFYGGVGNQVNHCFFYCAYHCIKTLAEDQVFRTMLCAPAAE